MKKLTRKDLKKIYGGISAPANCCIMCNDTHQTIKCYDCGLGNSCVTGTISIRCNNGNGSSLVHEVCDTTTW